VIIGREQRLHPGHSLAERSYISLLGTPVVGLRIRARTLLGLLPSSRGIGEVLDAGSGPGVITFLLAGEYPDARVTGVDLSLEEVDNCRAIASRGGFSNTSFQHADIARLPWKDRFDLIVCVDILEHIDDDGAAVASLCRALAPGGTLVLHVPAKFRRYPVFKRTPNFEVPSHVRTGYAPEEIREVVANAGLTIARTGHTFGFLETLANNLGYMITKAEKRNRLLYAAAFPFLNFLAWLGRSSRPGQEGAGVYVIAVKPGQHR